MSPSTLKEQEFRRFQEMLENDLTLKEIVDAAMNAESSHPWRWPLRIPYVSAPPLTDSPWK